MKAKSVAKSALTIETPEGIELSLPIADPVLRGYAYAIDFAIRGLVLYILALILFAVFASESRAVLGIYLILLFVLQWGYYVVFEVFYHGASPGKKLLGLKVVHDDLTPITFAGSVTRNLLRVVDWLPAVCGLGILSVLLSKDNKRIGDYVARTVVIDEKKLAKSKLIRAIDGKSAPPTVALTIDEQRAVIEFARFAETKSEDRAEEIVSNLQALFKEDDKKLLIKKLKQYAKWYLGE